MIYMFKAIHYCLLMYSRILEINVSKYISLILLIFLSAPALTWQACLKKTEVKLELITNINMLLMIEDGTRGGITHAIHRYAEANNKYMKNYDKNKESSCLMYLDTNNLCGWAMSQKLSVDGFKWKTDLSITDKKFIKNYDENSNIRYMLEVDIKYL